MSITATHLLYRAAGHALGESDETCWLCGGPAFDGMPVRDWVRLCASEPFRSTLSASAYRKASDLPRGAVVATCRLVGVYRIVRAGGEHGNAWAHATPCQAGDRHINFPKVSDEYAFGDYSPGRYMWVLDEVQALEPPVPARGGLGLWEWHNAIEV